MQRLAYHDRLLSSLNSNAEAIFVAQSKQAESQASMLDQMQTEMYMARGLLAEITASASSLQASVEKTSSQIASIATLSGLTSSFLRWGWLSLLVLILYQFSPRYAGYAIAIFGACLLLWVSGTHSPSIRFPSDVVLIHYASGYQVPLITVLKVLAVLIMMITAVLVYHLSASFHSTCNETLNLVTKFRFRHRPKDVECLGR